MAPNNATAIIPHAKHETLFLVARITLTMFTKLPANETHIVQSFGEPVTHK
jgi:hypothetical protein